MSTASNVIDRAQRFVDEGQPYTFGGKNQAMNKGNKHIVEGLRDLYGKGSGHYGHILGDDKTNTGKNYKKYVNAESSPYVFIDCSGLTDVAFKAGGINIGAGSSNQNDNAKNKVARIDPQKNPSAIKPGALLHRSGHVAVMGYDNKVIEAKGWKYGCVSGVTSVSSFTSAYNLSGNDGAEPVKEEKQQDLKVIGKATIVNISSYLNVRPEAGTAKAPIGKLYNGNQVDVTADMGKWYQIAYKGGVAYIHKDYAKMNDSGSNKQEVKKEEKTDNGIQQNKPETPITKTATLSTSEMSKAISYNKNNCSTALWKNVQKMLGLEQNGIVDEKSVQAVANWQATYNLVVDGQFGGGSKLQMAYLGYQDYISKGVQNDSSYDDRIKFVIDKYNAKRSTINQISQLAKLPPELVAAIWYREMSFADGKYLHNGDPLGTPTTHVPKGIMFRTDQFVEAAVDALDKNAKTKLSLSADSKDVAAMCAFSEAYNGFGYRNKGRETAYVTAGTSLYTGGKYVKDGVYDESVKDGQLGTMRIISELMQKFPR